MNNEVIITCAITGSGDTAGKHPELPITPRQIAESAIEAAKAGAAIVHLHAREADGTPTRNPDLYREMVGIIRESNTDVVINLTGGGGADLTMGHPDSPADFDWDQSDVAPAIERLVHIEELKPEICTLDCGTMNFGNGNLTMINTPDLLRVTAKHIQKIGVKPEIEVFELGHRKSVV